MGKDAPYIPGWDCHGLPIEWKVEEQYRKKKLDKDEVPIAQFRAECRAYAEKWVAVQSEQFQRLGVMGEWDDPYLTMKYEAEAKIVEELLKFAEIGQLYRGAKPVMWRPVEKTALAEAEVEYEDIVSTQIDVGVRDRREPDPGTGRRARGDLDDHALDDPGQPGDRLWAGHRIRHCSTIADASARAPSPYLAAARSQRFSLQFDLRRSASSRPA